MSKTGTCACCKSGDALSAGQRKSNRCGPFRPQQGSLTLSHPRNWIFLHDAMCDSFSPDWNHTLYICIYIYVYAIYVYAIYVYAIYVHIYIIIYIMFSICIWNQYDRDTIGRSRASRRVYWWQATSKKHPRLGSASGSLWELPSPLTCRGSKHSRERCLISSLSAIACMHIYICVYIYIHLQIHHIHSYTVYISYIYICTSMCICYMYIHLHLHVV